ncbi:MAG: signal peptidase II [Acidimicrobiales bacterium]
MQERGTSPPLSEPAQRHRGATRLLVAGAVACCVVAVDQLTKSWAVSRLSRGDIHVFWKLDFVLEYNSGSSFSFAQGWAPVIGGAAAVVVAILLVMVRHARSNAVAAALGLVIGGALGNLSDRVFRAHHGAVVDFIALHFWPTFNVADSCVVVGSILLVILLWRSQPQPASGSRASGSPPSGSPASKIPGSDQAATGEPGANTPAQA